jgi:hypothetical protein
MQSLNTSVPSNVKVRLNLWDREKRKSSHQSARCGKGAGSATRRIEKQEAIPIMQKKSKNEVREENGSSKPMTVDQFIPGENSPSRTEECRCWTEQTELNGKIRLVGISSCQ